MGKRKRKQARRFSLADYRELSTTGSGACIRCGEFRDGCEPDADGYRCESCGADAVQGCDNLLAMDLVDEPTTDEEAEPQTPEELTGAAIGGDSLAISRLLLNQSITRRIECESCRAILDQRTAAHVRLSNAPGGACICPDCFAFMNGRWSASAASRGAPGWIVTRWDDGEKFIPAGFGGAV